jgi:hypothetical protein
MQIAAIPAASIAQRRRKLPGRAVMLREKNPEMIYVSCRD